jgi:hypothetical protein
MADPVQEGIDVGYLVVFGVIAYLAYLAYQALSDPTSGAGTWLCQNLGVNCAAGAPAPTGGLGSIAQSIGTWWGNASASLDQANVTATNAVQTVVQTPAMVGSVLTTPAPPTPAAPSLGLPAGYNMATGTIQ